MSHGSHSKLEKKGPGLKKLEKLVKELKINPEVRVGIFQGSNRHAGGITNVEVGIINEFGAPSAGIPARPFLSTAADIHKRTWMNLMVKALEKALEGKMTPIQALEVVGLKAAADVKKVLLTHAWVQNKPGTIKRKGSSRPLVDTGQLVNSITSKSSAHGKK